MAKKLTKIVDKSESPFKSREVDFSSEESKERTKKVLYKQKQIRSSYTVYPSDLHKVTFPSYPIGK